MLFWLTKTKTRNIFWYAVFTFSTNTNYNSYNPLKNKQTITNFTHKTYFSFP